MAMDDTALIDSLATQNPDWVHAANPNAYGAFANGKVLFDVSVDSILLKKFEADNMSEFGSKFQKSNSGGFPWTTLDGVRVYCTYHPDLFYKYIAAPELRKLEKQYPELFA